MIGRLNLVLINPWDKVRLRNLSESSWLSKKMYKEFSEIVRKVLLAKEVTERMRRGETH